MDSNERTLQILLKFALDSQAMGRVKSGTSTIEKELDSIRGKALQTQKALLDMKESAQQAGRSFAQIFATGVGVTGGIFAIAQRYVADAKVATATTKEWLEATERLSNSQRRIGAVFAKEALPLLKQAADLAERAASFAEKNPDLIKAALNVGMVTATLGAVGMAVTKGIQIYADAKMILVGAQQLMAGKLMAQAAKEQLAAAAASSKMSGGQIAQNLRGQFGLGGGAAAGGSMAGTLAAAALAIVAGVIASGVAVSLVNQLLEKTGVNKKIEDAQTAARENNARIYPMLINDPEKRQQQVELNKAIAAGDTQKVKELTEAIKGLGNSSEDAARKVKGATVDSSSLVRITETGRQIVDLYVQMLEEEKQATRQYYEDRNRIIAQANQQAMALGMSYARSVVQANRQYQQTIGQITANYQQQAIASEQSYNAQREQIIRDGGEAIREIEQRHQENLRRLTEEHNERVDDLVANRDALGLVREMRDFNKRKAEMEREANQEIAARRRDLAMRLQDMAKAHAQERAQRLAEYKAQLLAAKQQHEEEQKQRAEAYRAELRAQMKAKADALRELDKGFKSEQQRRREAFVAQVRDLDASMQNEQKRKREYYAAMLKDAEAFLKAYRETMPSGSNISFGGGSKGNSGQFPVRDQGGYAQRGVYALAQDGRREFVLSGATTKAAEQAIGGALSQSNVMRAMSGRGIVTVYDHRRFDSRLTAEDRRMIQTDTIETLKGLIANGV